MTSSKLTLVSTDAADSDAPSAGDTTLAASALTKILALIRSGELPPGAPINEKYLAERFRMSRGPVREAIKTLEGRKLVTRMAFKQARVVQLDKTQIREIFEFRQALEGMACRLATRAMSEDAIRDLAAKAAVEGPNQAFASRQPFHFHRAIVEACGNSRIQAALGSDIYDMVGLYRLALRRGKGSEAGRGEGHWAPSPAAGRPEASEHWQIARAMLARDEELAESLMRAHLARVMETILSAPK